MFIISRKQSVNYFQILLFLGPYSPVEIRESNFFSYFFSNFEFKVFFFLFQLLEIYSSKIICISELSSKNEIQTLFVRLLIELNKISLWKFVRVLFLASVLRHCSKLQLERPLLNQPYRVTPCSTIGGFDTNINVLHISRITSEWAWKQWWSHMEHAAQLPPKS